MLERKLSQQPVIAGSISSCRRRSDTPSHDKFVHLAVLNAKIKLVRFIHIDIGYYNYDFPRHLIKAQRVIWVQGHRDLAAFAAQLWQI
jgi:hypothetical protein